MNKHRAKEQTTLPLVDETGVPMEPGDDIELPNYIEEPLHFSHPRRVIEVLKQFDWSFTNDDTRFLTHDVHPYPAKYIPQIPGNIISRLSTRGELVLDPFGGSGTTALEAVRLGRRALSIDANPVATLIGQVKTSKLDKSTQMALRVLHSSLATELSSLPSNTSELISKYKRYVPDIFNRAKWFADAVCGELALIKHRLHKITSEEARNIGLLTLSRIIIRVSFQDSETRYKSTPREIPVGYTLRLYLKELDAVRNNVGKTNSVIRYGSARFLTSDIRYIQDSLLQENSIDLAVTSPPYGNATDYHLYHRFRLLWLGFKPTEIGDVEIGSHLKHQRQDNGFESYLNDLVISVERIHRALKPGRYAALVLGDSIYAGNNYSTAEILADQLTADFDVKEIIERPIHKTKRSFAAPARRATTEKILFLRKKAKPFRLIFHPPAYKMWPYELQLRASEFKLIDKKPHTDKYAESIALQLDPYKSSLARKFTFTSKVEYPGGFEELTWQTMLENGGCEGATKRKEPKYVTHGLHPYKGKFYPQLAKSLINIANLKEGAKILDVFCGCGTTILESYLNGYRGYGVDMNPLAAKIANVKVAILDTDPAIFRDALQAILGEIKNAPKRIQFAQDEFVPETLDEITRWFPSLVIGKINWLLKTINRVSGGIVREYFQVVLSSIIRDVSHQDPDDLRIRYRKIKSIDADVLGIYEKQLLEQAASIETFWSIKGYAPNHFYPTHVACHDCRDPKAFSSLGVKPESIDLVLTSPPYATALPYIDTDRLSLLTILGISSDFRRPIEHDLIGSREITISERRQLEVEVASNEYLPLEVIKFLQTLLRQIRKSDGGFRKQNMPALLFRFFLDMQQVMVNIHDLLKPGSEAMIIIGDNKTRIDDKDKVIPTARFLELIAEKVGFQTLVHIPISVSTENLIHINNSITENVVLRFKKRK